MKRAAADHPKLEDLADAIAKEYKHHAKFARVMATGVVERLWIFCGKFTPQGDIGRRTDEQICRFIGWPKGDERKLIDLLLRVNLLQSSRDHRLIVWDWADHCDQTTKRALQRKGLSFACPDKTSLPEPEPEPEPVSISHSVDDPPFDPVGGEGATQEWGLTPELPDPLDGMIAEAAEALHARHPAPRCCGIAEIRQKLRSIAQHRPALAQAPDGKKSERQAWLLAIVNENHAAWCATEQWSKDGGEYAKGLDNWLAPTKMRYLQPPKQSGPPPATQAPRMMM